MKRGELEEAGEKEEVKIEKGKGGNEAEGEGKRKVGPGNGGERRNPGGKGQEEF